MLWTLVSEAFRPGAGQLRITWFPRWTPESNSVRCCTRSTGGSGGRRFPQFIDRSIAVSSTAVDNKREAVANERSATRKQKTRRTGATRGLDGFTEYTG
jgi:hypothetical protein